jgi:hypothetical protein
MSVEYQIKVRDGNNNEIGQFRDVKSLKFGKRLNNYGSCQFTIPANDMNASSLVALRIYSVWVFRIEDGGSPVLLWSGEQFYRRGQLDSRGDNWVTIYCYDWLELLNHKFTSSYVRYELIDAGQIALALIGGAYGITEGEIVETQLRSREYINQNVMEALINLSNVLGGSDFEINNFKVFNWKPIGIDRADDVVFQYGINVTDMSIEEDFTTPANRAIVLGQADESGELVRVEVDDTASQASISLREYVDTEIDISEELTFQEKGEAVLRKFRYPVVKISSNHLPSTRPKISEFAVGDTVRLVAQSGIYNINEKYRVFEWEVTYNADNTESLSTVLGKFTL